PLMPVVTLRAGDREFVVHVEAGRVLVDGVETHAPPHAEAAADGDVRWVFLDGEVYELEVHRAGRRRGTAHQPPLSAPMPATVRRGNDAVGARAARGATLLVLEPMKTALPVRAPADAVVTAISCRVGDLVQPGAALV